MSSSRAIRPRFDPDLTPIVDWVRDAIGVFHGDRTALHRFANTATFTEGIGPFPWNL